MRWAPSYTSVAVLSVSLLTGCDGPAHPLTSPVVAPPKSEARTAVADTEGISVDPQLEPFAHDLALALQQQAAAAALRDAMRASKVAEHAIVLQDWIASPQGQPVASAAAAIRGVSTSVWIAQVQSLPRLDASLPIRAHRMHWQATPGLTVGVTRARDPHAVAAYRGDGRRIRVTSARKVQALLLLQPSERRFRRIDAQKDAVGLVVQDSTEEDLAGAYLWPTAKGDTMRVELADLVTLRRASGAQKPGIELVRRTSPAARALMSAATSAVARAVATGHASTHASVKAASSAPADTTFLTSYDWFYDIPNRLLESIHIEFVASYQITSSSPLTVGSLTFQGVNLDQTYTLNMPLIYARIRDSTADQLEVNVCSDEIDTVNGVPPQCDTPDIIGWHDQNQIKTLYGFSQPHQDGNFTLNWTPKPAPKGAVTITFQPQDVSPDPNGFYPGLYWSSELSMYTGLGYTVFRITLPDSSHLDWTAATLLTSDPSIITWETDDCFVDSYGNTGCGLIGHKVGTTTVTVSVGTTTASQPFTVAPSPVKGFSYHIGTGGSQTITSMGLYVGESPHVEVWALDKNGNQITLLENLYPYYIYASQNTAIATIAEYDGTAPFWDHAAITGVAPGKTTISSTITQVTGYLKITVGQNASYVTDVSITPNNQPSVVYGTPLQMTATAFNAKGGAVTPQTFTWTSSNPSVASVSGSGLVTAHLAGTTVISATSSSQSVVASQIVAVLPYGTISGPTTLTTAGGYTWTASGSGCNPTCTYTWREEQLNVQNTGWFTTPGTTTHTQSLQQAFGDFNMTLYVTSNGQTNYSTPIFDVTNNIGGGGTGCNPTC